MQFLIILTYNLHMNYFGSGVGKLEMSLKLSRNDWEVKVQILNSMQLWSVRAWFISNIFYLVKNRKKKKFFVVIRENMLLPPARSFAFLKLCTSNDSVTWVCFS